MLAASSGGNASNKMNAVTNCAHTKNGRRIQVMPGARNWMMVAMKFTAPNKEDVIRSTMPTSQKAWPCVGMVVASGEYEVQPACGAPPGMKKLANITTPPRKNAWKLAMFTRGKVMSGAPIINGTT